MCEKRTISILIIISLIVTCIPLFDTNAKIYAATSNDSTVKTISAGQYHSMAIDDNDNVWVWGDNAYAQLGDGTIIRSYCPKKTIINSSSVLAGGIHSMALKIDGSLWTWGDNIYGQLGNGDETGKKSLVTIPIEIMKGVSSSSAGATHSMAIKNDGSLWTWGLNNNGELGDGTYGLGTLRSTPVKIMDDVSYICAGQNNSMAIKNDGSLWAWGSNNQGQLGDGTCVDKSTPVKIMDDVSIVSNDGWHSMAIKNDGSLWSWGYNYYGQLGDGTNTDSYTPIKIMEDVSFVEAGYTHSMVIKKDESLWVFGSNYYGQLGDGTYIDKNNPIKIMDDVSSVSGSIYHSMAIKKDGSLWAWGYNNYGQLGDGTTNERHTPVQVLFSEDTDIVNDKKFDIKLDPEGGKVSTSRINVTVGSKIPTLPQATRKGYIFKGWFTAISGGVQVKKGDAVTDQTEKILYAQWKKVTVGKASIKKAKNAKKKKINITIKKINGVAGYQIVLSKSKKFKKPKRVFTDKQKNTIKKLTKNKKYYIKVRAYKIDSVGKKVYGKYSKVRTVIIKK